MSCARPDLWEPRAGNSPGPPERFLLETAVVGGRGSALDTLGSVPGVLDDPAAMTIVGDSSVVLRCFGWVDQRQNSFFKVRSEATRRVKIAFNQTGIVMPEPVYRLRIFDRVNAGGKSQQRHPYSGTHIPA